MTDQIDHRQRVTETLFKAIEEVNRQLSKDRRVEPLLDAPLIGPQGKLDSLGLINLIVATEQKIAEEFGLTINLADEKAMSQDDSPFGTVRTLTQHICELLDQNGP